MDIEAILTAHDYHPCGRMYFGKAEVERALDACLEPFGLIKKLISEYPEADDEKISEVYNSQNKLPTLASRVVREYRKII